LISNIYFFYFWFSFTIFHISDFSLITASNTIVDDATKQVTHRLFNTNLYSKLMQKSSASLTVFKYDLMMILVIGLLFGPPCTHTVVRLRVDYFA